MKNHTINKQLMAIDYKYGLALKALAKKVLTNYFSIPITADDLYNCFLFYLPKVLDKITGSESKKLNTIKLYAKRFYTKQCRMYTGNRYKTLNLANTNKTIASDVVPNPSSIDITNWTYQERQIYKILMEDHRYPIKVLSKQLNISSFKAKKLITTFKTKFKKMYT